MKTGQSIFLVGPMGVGKTTVGRQLAKLLGYEFIDSDHEIESRTGAKISWIFDMEGEEGFRQREQAMIDELSQRENIVLATGGGAVLREENRQALKQRGIVVYLEADVDELISRTSHDKNRPLLQTENPRETLQKLMQERESLYQEIADLVFDTQRKNSHSSAHVLQKLLARINKE